MDRRFIAKNSACIRELHCSPGSISTRSVEPASSRSTIVCGSGFTRFITQPPRSAIRMRMTVRCSVIRLMFATRAAATTQQNASRGRLCHPDFVRSTKLTARTCGRCGRSRRQAAGSRPHRASVKLVEKIRTGPRVKKVDEAPKPPYQRLLYSPLVTDEVKDELRRRARELHIVKQKRLVDQAVAKLLRIQQDKNQQQLPFSGSSTTTLGKIPE